MAQLDLATLLSDPSVPNLGLAKQEQIAVVQSLLNQMASNPGNKAIYLNQLNQMVGGNVAQQIVGAINSPTPPPEITAPTATTISLPNQILNPAQLPPSTGTPGTPGAGSTTGTNPALPSPEFNQYGGFDPNEPQLNYGNVQKDIGAILNEAELQKGLSAQTLEAQNAARQKYLVDLSSLLQTQQAQQLTTELPGVYEDLNTRGLLRSSALGDKLSYRQAELAKETSSKLAMQGLSYNDLYTSGLGGIQDTYLGARNSALQRKFSLQDYDTNVKASRDLGFALQPQQQQSSGKGTTALSTGLSGAEIGAGVNGPFGAIIGGTAGLVAGGAAQKSGK